MTRSRMTEETRDRQTQHDKAGGFVDSGNRWHPRTAKRDVAFAERQHATLLRHRALAVQRDQYDDIVTRQFTKVTTLVANHLTSEPHGRQHTAARQTARTQRARRRVYRSLRRRLNVAGRHDIVQRALQFVRSPRGHLSQGRSIWQVESGDIAHGCPSWTSLGRLMAA